MGNFILPLAVEEIARSKQLVVPALLTQHYFRILKKKAEGMPLTDNERYYYNHYIKKKIQGMSALFGLDPYLHGKGSFIEGRAHEASEILRKYSRRHKGRKMFVSGSFLYKKKFHDIDLFILSRYRKEDYREGRVHVNFLTAGAEDSLFFCSATSISVSNFMLTRKVKETFTCQDILMLYELVILLMLQKDDCIQELRSLLLRLHYLSSGAILDSKSLSELVTGILASKHPVKTVNQSLIAHIIISFDAETLTKVLKDFQKKSRQPEKGKSYENWKVYRRTYKEALEVVT